MKWTHYVYILGIFAAVTAMAPFVNAQVINSENACTWGISSDDLSIPSGSIMTEAVLVLHNVRSLRSDTDTGLYVQLLDNPDSELEEIADAQPGNFFGTHGTLLRAIQASELSSTPQMITIDLNQLDDPDSWTRDIFETAPVITLANSTTVTCSSSMLALFDYAGTGRSFGFGLDCDGVSVDAISLDITIQSTTELVPPTTLTLTIGTPNTAPALELIGNQTGTETEALTFAVYATDADDDSLTYSVTNLPAGATFVNQTFSWTPTYNQSGTYPLTISVSDGMLSDTETIAITVDNTNRAPVLDQIENQFVTATDLLTFAVSCSDADSDTVSLFAQNLPEGATFVNDTFTFSPTSQQAGTYQVTITANDSHGGTDTITVQITVESQTTNWTRLIYDDFEAGMGHYTDGGRDCKLYTGKKYSHQGSNAADIQDNSGSNSSFYLTNGIDISGYSEIKIEFWYMPVSMDNSNEDFRLDYWNGSQWITLKTWAKNTDFQNNVFYSESIVLTNKQITFSSKAKIRFVCDASSNYDDIMIDEIGISVK